MIIDDEPLDQIIYRRVLMRSGMVDDIIGFPLAEEALDYLRAGPVECPDVIFLDIRMPVMNGFEFLDQAISEFGDHFRECVIIMLTTSSDPADRERAAGYSMVRDFLSKPLTAENVQHVAHILDRHSGSLQ